ncbi:domain of Kin17 curved DNA-binding protein-domain-containing protein [Exophiala viscosa]|uniref:Domain of Kin17 curved DNA-binding protein-domain-containing protein n=1 Tax=Exophiala viscosa TaxID=2486360 RepID=A0AAN6DXZ0_9EURO|nr:domain of Kin17 curved DNA-binding protein-domain-containing protein [Exophiala viscosa]
MPRAEVGSTKHIANQMKSKGLQRLRWYCQACQRQMRDENGFKCHVAAESHVRQMQIIGEDPRKAINDFSNQFQRDFLQLLRTGHGEKKVNVNHFYQEYIHNKEHIHMNATKWPSLTEFAKHLGRQGLCRVDEDDKNDGKTGASGLTISWIDNSPDALRRQEALRKRETQDRGDEEREQRMIQEQIRRARRETVDETLGDEEEPDVGVHAEGGGIKRKDGEKIVLSFGAKKSTTETTQPPTPPLSDEEESISEQEKIQAGSAAATPRPNAANSPDPSEANIQSAQPKAPISMSFGAASAKPKNVFAAASKRNPLAGSKKPLTTSTSRPMSEAERIMKEEIERKRQRDEKGFKPSANVFKKQRVS